MLSFPMIYDFGILKRASVPRVLSMPLTESDAPPVDIKSALRASFADDRSRFVLDSSTVARVAPPKERNPAPPVVRAELVSSVASRSAALTDSDERIHGFRLEASEGVHASSSYGGGDEHEMLHRMDRLDRLLATVQADYKKADSELDVLEGTIPVRRSVLYR